MLLWIMVFVGILMFVSGLYFLIKNYRNGKYVEKYGTLSYIGLCLTILGIIILMEPVFKNLSGNSSGIVPYFIGLFISYIASRLLLKPAFLKSKYKSKK